MSHWLCLALLSAPISSLSAASLQVLPNNLTLQGAQTSQQLLAVMSDGPIVVADQTAKATFQSSNPAIAKIVGSSIVAVADGEVTLTAMLADGQKATQLVKVTGTTTPQPRSFRHHVQAILTRSGCNSGACHGALAGKGGMKLSLRGYDPESDHFVITRQLLGRRLDARETANSLLLTKATRTLPHGGGTRFDADSPEYRTLFDWIATGAVGPQGNDPTLQSLEVFPKAARLKPQDELSILVRATYSDGRTEEVTRWTRFGSSEEQVANVDQEGRVRIIGHGEAAITIGFGTRVASMTISSPYVQEVAAEVFTQSPKANFIDEHVLAKLQSLNLPPSPMSSDNEFVRRVYLDTIGVLPTPDEVRAFVADTAPNKRSVLIDALLKRPEFVDYWTYKWSDLLLVSSRKLPQPQMWGFHRAVRQSVADNQPWDQFARQLLTANGSTLDQGLGNYFVLHKDTALLTEATAVTFLGMSITCARCHNHPLEKWTQDQYWQMANLFSRVTLKNGERGGEVLVQPIREGDVLHPRRGIGMRPTPLDGVPLMDDAYPDRRAYFADWLTDAKNPYFAKAIINRIWRNYMGRGLVEAEDDLRETNPPTNRALFDALAADYIQNGYDNQRLMRLILNSAAYQRTAKPLPGNQADDRFYSRYLPRRLSAEVVLDAYSQISQVPTPFNKVITGVEGGTAATANYPLGMRALQLPDVRIASAFLDTFGRPDREQTCACERESDSSVSQALHLNNGNTLNEKLRDKASRIESWVKEGTSDAEIVKRLFLLALSREPMPHEIEQFRRIMSEAPADQRRATLEDACWAVLTSREFLFNR